MGNPIAIGGSSWNDSDDAYKAILQMAGKVKAATLGDYTVKARGEGFLVYAQGTLLVELSKGDVQDRLATILQDKGISEEAERMKIISLITKLKEGTASDIKVEYDQDDIQAYFQTAGETEQFVKDLYQVLIQEADKGRRLAFFKATVGLLSASQVQVLQDAVFKYIDANKGNQDVLGNACKLAAYLYRAMLDNSTDDAAKASAIVALLDRNNAGVQEAFVALLTSDEKKALKKIDLPVDTSLSTIAAYKNLLSDTDTVAPSGGEGVLKEEAAKLEAERKAEQIKKIKSKIGDKYVTLVPLFRSGDYQGFFREWTGYFGQPEINDPANDEYREAFILRRAALKEAIDEAKKKGSLDLKNPDPMLHMEFMRDRVLAYFAKLVASDKLFAEGKITEGKQKIKEFLRDSPRVGVDSEITQLTNPPFQAYQIARMLWVKGSLFEALKYYELCFSQKPQDKSWAVGDVVLKKRLMFEQAQVYLALYELKKHASYQAQAIHVLEGLAKLTSKGDPLLDEVNKYIKKWEISISLAGGGNVIERKDVSGRVTDTVAAVAQVDVKIRFPGGFEFALRPVLRNFKNFLTANYLTAMEFAFSHVMPTADNVSMKYAIFHDLYRDPLRTSLADMPMSYGAYVEMAGRFNFKQTLAMTYDYPETDELSKHASKTLDAKKDILRSKTEFHAPLPINADHIITPGIIAEYVNTPQNSSLPDLKTFLEIDYQGNFIPAWLKGSIFYRQPLIPGAPGGGDYNPVLGAGVYFNPGTDIWGIGVDVSGRIGGPLNVSGKTAFKISF